MAIVGTLVLTKNTILSCKNCFIFYFGLGTKIIIIGHYTIWRKSLFFFRFSAHKKLFIYYFLSFPTTINNYKKLNKNKH